MKEKLSLENIICLFVIGAVIGFGFETIWHLLKNHVLINKQGLMYGPFKPIYGFGCILMTVCFLRFRNKSSWFILILGSIIGTAFEYFCSIFQEICFGTYTWTYAHFKYSISSRVYLPYSLGWGLLAVLWIKVAYPYFEKYFSKINSKSSKILINFIGILMIFNLLITALATDRMAERAEGREPINKIESIVDKLYPDEVMHKKFPKLRIIK